LHQGHLYGLRGKELKERITEILTRVGLLDRRDISSKLSPEACSAGIELAKACFITLSSALDEPPPASIPALGAIFGSISRFSAIRNTSPHRNAL